mgnify:CR=1 FL=1
MIPPEMPFSLIDKITELLPGQEVTAEKTLRGDEQYLKDHFPNFPCMPGVLMLEAMFQASCWLLRQTDEFKRPIVMLKEARNVKYGNFVAPGQTLVVNVQVKGQPDDNLWKVKGQGTVNGKPAVSGILLLEQFRLEEKLHTPAAMDHVCRRNYLHEFDKIYQSAAVETA